MAALPVQAELTTYQPQASAAPIERSVSAEPTHQEPVPQEAAREEPVQEAPAYQEPVRAAAPPPPPRPAASPAPVKVQEVLQQSGLVMIETDASKARAAIPEQEPVQLGRPRRERPRPVEEPLQQVETKN